MYLVIKTSFLFFFVRAILGDLGAIGLNSEELQERKKITGYPRMHLPSQTLRDADALNSGKLQENVY